MTDLLPPASAGVLLDWKSDEERRDQACQHRHAPVAADTQRQEKRPREDEARSKKT
jgi:hypothetical protein